MDNSGAIALNESNFDREINSETPVLVDFWAEWCGPCKLIAPLLDEIAREKAGAVKVAKVNVDENQSLSFKYNIRAINLSLGRPIYEACSRDPLCRAVETAWNSGIVTVTAAGNLGRNGYATILCPGNSPHSITVGAMKTMATYASSDDLIASYSSKGPTYIDLRVKPDVVAPGNLVVSLLAPGSTLAKTYPGNIVGPCEPKSRSNSFNVLKLDGVKKSRGRSDFAESFNTDSPNSVLPS